MNEIPSYKRLRGRIWIVLTVAVTIFVGATLYNEIMAPRWIRDFGLDIAAKATIVSMNAEATVFSTMRGRPEPDSPYIYLNNSATFPWDRVFFVPSGGVNLDALVDLDWNEASLEDLQSQMKQDARYQLIAFVKDGRVVERGYYFTLWADLTALGRVKGFNRQEAVFLADSNGEIYTLTIANNAPLSACSS